jgi:hypothetical protein
MRFGRAVLRPYMNVRNAAPGPATVLFDATRKSGAAMDLALRIRLYDTVTYEPDGRIDRVDRRAKRTY